MVGAFLQKMRKIFFFFAVQIENTEINILQKEWLEKLFFTFSDKKKNYFWIH